MVRSLRPQGRQRNDDNPPPIETSVPPTYMPPTPPGDQRTDNAPRPTTVKTPTNILAGNDDDVDDDVDDVTPDAPPTATTPHLAPTTVTA